MTTLFADQALLPGGWARDVAVRITDGRIAEVAPGAAEGEVRVGTLLPAPANVHSHAFQRAMAGRTERRGPRGGADSFWTWRREMFRFLQCLTPEDVEAVAALAQVEMLEAGYAAVAEFHYLHHAPGGAEYDDPGEMAARVAAAAGATGIGLTLLPVMYRQGGCDGRALAPGQDRFGSDADGFARLMEGARRAIAHLPHAALGVAPHSLRAVPPGALAEAAALAPEGPIHMHLAEQVAEVEEVRATLGARPAEWLLANAPVDARWCLIHCTQMEARETEALARTGAVAGLCPITEANLGDGIFDGPRFLGAGGRIAVGTDSNVAIDFAGELRALEYSQRLRDRSRAALTPAGASTGRTLYDAVLTGGARAVGRGSGAIRAGALADLLALDGPRAALFETGGDAALDAWIFAGGAGWVSDVWSAGRHVVSEGRHVARGAVEAAYVASMRRWAA